MAVSQEQKVDFLLKKLGFTKTKTGLAVDSTLTGTKKAGFAEAIPSPLIIANSSLWNEADSIPATPPGSDTNQVRVYLAATSGHRMTVDSTVANNRAFIAFSTYNNSSSTRLDNWIDTQFGAGYLIKVFRGDPNSGGVQLSAAGSGNADGWFFDYSAGVLNFNDTNVPSGVATDNIYIVGYRYIGQTGAPTSGISTFSYSDLTVERNLDVGVQGGISTFRNNIDAKGILDVDGLTKLDDVNVSQHLRVQSGGGLQVAGVTTTQVLRAQGATFTTTAGGVTDTAYNAAIVMDEPARIYTREEHNGYMRNLIGKVNDVISIGSSNTGFVDQINLFPGNAGPVQLFHGSSGTTPKLYTQLGGVKVNGTTRTDNLVVLGVTTSLDIDANGNIDLAGDLDVDGHTNLDNVSVSGVSTFNGDANFGGNVSIAGTLTYEDVKNVDSVGIITARSGIDCNADLDVDGHTNLDNVSVAGVSTFAGITTITGNTLFTKQLSTIGVSTFNEDVIFNTSNGSSGGEAFWDYSDGSLRFNDNVKTKFGNSYDFQIYHHNNENIIASLFGSHPIKIKTKLSGSTEDGIVIIPDGAVELYHDNVKRLETSSVGVSIPQDLDVDGHTNLDNISIAGITTHNEDVWFKGATSGRDAYWDKSDNSLEFYDNAKAAFGTNSKATLHHSGAQFFISNTQGGIYLRNNNKNSLIATPSDSIWLYYNNDIKFETASSGVNVSGTTTTTGLAVTGVSTFSGLIDANGIIEGVAGENKIPSLYSAMTNLPSAGSYHGMFAHVHATGRGYFAHAGNWLELVNKETNGTVGTGTETYSIGHITGTGLILNGDIDVDGHTNLDNVSVAGVSTFSNFIYANQGILIRDDNKSILLGTSDDMRIRHTGNHSEITDEGTGDLRLGSNRTVIGNPTFSETQARFIQNGAVELYYDNVKKISTTGVGVTILGNTETQTLNVTGVSTFAANARFKGTIGVHDGTTGANGQYLRSTGTGVTWGSFPTMRTSQSFTASAGQTTFSFTYNVGFLDVYVNGVKLSSSEFTANNGSSVVLAVGSFVGDIVELISYFTTSYAAGSDTGIENLVEDTSPQLGGNLDLFNKFITGTGGVSITGVITATSFSGTVPSSSLSGALPALDGSALTGIVASGSGVVVKNSGSTVGTAGTIDFGNNLSVSPVSAGIVTITGAAGGGGSGISTISGVVNIANDLDVDGHTNLDNVSIAGITTMGNNLEVNGNTGITIRGANPRLIFTDTDSGPDFSIRGNGGQFRIRDDSASQDRLIINNQGNFDILQNLDVRKDLDVNGLTTLDDVNVSSGATFRDVDVDGHTNLDNVSVAGVTTFSSAITVSDIRNNSINLRNAAGGATYAAFSNGGAATLYFNNAARLATSNAGITVTGTVSATSFSGDGSGLTNLPGISTAHVRAETLTVSGVTTFTGDVNANKLKFPDSNGSSTNIALFGASEDLKIYHQGNSDIKNITGYLRILSDNFAVMNEAGTQHIIRGENHDATGEQSVRLYYAGNQKLITTNTGAEVTGSMTATSFVGDGSGLTGVVGSGSGVVVKDDGSTVGTAGTFDFTSPINITPLSAGITTVGIDTNQFNVNNLNVSGISTFAGIISLAEKIVHTDDTNTSINFSSLDTISFVTGGGTRLQVGPVGQLGIAGATYGNPGQVLTSQGSGSIVTWADPPNNVGITTNITGSFTATAGSPSEIHSFVYGTNDRVVEYTILIEQGSNFQTLKVLASRQGTTIHSTQFAVFFNSSLLAQFDVIISSSNIRLRATPETGVTGTLAYRIKREVM